MKLLKLTSIEGTKYFQQDIRVVYSHISASAVWRQSGIQSAFTASVPPLPVIACCSFPSERVSCLSASPLSCPLTFSLSHLSPDSPRSGVSLLQQRGPEALGSGAKLWRRVLFVEAGKATPSRFRLFSSKLAAGVAYLTRTEIPVVERQGVALITSAAAVSFRLIERTSRIPFGSRTLPPKLLLLSGKMIACLFLPRLRCSQGLTWVFP